MLQTFTKQEDIPEGLREHYSKREDGKWYADIPDDHPAIKNNAKLLSDKSAAEAKTTKLESDLESARAGNLGRGQVAMTKADADLLTQYKAHGTPDELGAVKTEHATLKSKDDQRTRDDNLRKVATALGYTNAEAFVRLPNLPEFTSKPSKDGKTVEWFAQSKDEKGVITEKPAKEFIEASEDVKPFMLALKQAEGVRVPTTGPTTTTPDSDPHAWAKDFAKSYVEQSQPVGDPFKAFTERSSA